MKQIISRSISKKAGILLDIFRGLDFEIFLNFKPQKQKILFLKTLKEIEILIKLNQFYNENISHRKNWLYLVNILKHESDVEKMKFILSSLIEFGKTPDILTLQELKIAQHTEILQEMNHFSRIMFLDKILNYDKYTLTPSEILRECWDFARFITLLCERKKYRDNIDIELKPVIKNFSLPLQNVITNDKNLAVLKANDNFTNIFIFVKAQNDITKNDIARTFYNFLRKYPIEVAILLLDYYLFLLNLIQPHKPQKLQLTISEEINENRNFLKFFSNIFSVSLLIGESKVVKIVNANKYEYYLGNLFNEVKKIEVETPKFKRNLIFIEDAAQVVEKISDAELEGYLKENNNPLNTIRQILAKNKVKQTVFVQELNKIKQSSNQNYDYTEKIRVITAQKKTVEKWVQKGIKKVIIEAGHIHADREIDENQLIGLEIAKEIDAALSRNKIETEKILMIDELHVVNSLDYKKYLAILEEKKWMPNEIVFESSDIIKEIAIDMLKIILKNSSNNKDYKLFLKGGNLYIQINNKIIELVEDIEDKFIIGCILFDAAFCVYKANRNAAVKIYNKLWNLDEDFNLHKEMLNIYLNYKLPFEREENVYKLIATYKKGRSFNLKKLKEEIDYLPYQKIITPEVFRCKQLLNIQEMFYRPQQGKLNLFLEIFKLPPVYSLYYTLTHNLVLESTKLE